ncbi:DUF4397 domain-containing protein [Mucilaginibacter segetis]|uniref:DUF4397 domain-containing protein n=1 Tax=Mucilaginibacter segetis TaxID=2793071 RepID=A0A934PQR0_9SPHI|nr:DUF4397 domain-containing protein [Mucilaginibacter segetis]MBK0378389.1 DUF4397 domain-containing protein [Mucilaginibacter segetis]
MNSKLSVLVVLILAIAFTSCKKNDDIPTTTLTTNLNVINATNNVLNYYINGTRINTSSSLYPLGASGYIGVPIGEQNYAFKINGTPNVLFELPLALDTNKIYSLYAGNTADDSFSTIDTLIADTNKLAKVRFVNASPDAGNLDVLVGDTVNFKSRAFKSSSVFLPVGSGLKNIRVYKTGTTVPQIDTTLTLLSGRIYTLFTKVAINGNRSVDIGLFVNR